MYTAEAIENLPLLTAEEKNNYRNGLQGLWAKVNGSSPDSAENQQARKKIADFSRMLIAKIQSRRNAQQQEQTGQAQQQQGQQQANVAAPQPQTSPVPPSAAVQAQQRAQQQQARPVNPPQVQNAAQQAQNQGQQKSPVNPGASTAGAPAHSQAGQPGKVRLPEEIVRHVNQFSFRPPPSLLAKSVAEAQKWVEEMKDKYGQALAVMENTKKQVNMWDKMVADRNASGNPLNESEMKQLAARKAQQLKQHTNASNWVKTFRTSQSGAQPGVTAPNGGATPATAASQAAAGQAPQMPQMPASQQNKPATPNPAAPVNAAVEAAKQQQQQQQVNRPQPPKISQTPILPPQRPGPSVQQPANTAQSQNDQTNNSQQPQPPHQQTPVPTPQQARAQTQPTVQAGPAAGQGRALTHSAALSLANSRASNTPGSATVQGQQQQAPAPGTPGSAGPQGQAPNPMGVQQQGHPHAHPGTQPQPSIQKMAIPKQLPERATTVPTGVTVGGGVNTGRPTMSQGSGTLGGVMNQPAVTKVPAYNYEAEGDHVLSKKKLDELVKQVCGGSVDGQDDNMLTPDVEEVRQPLPEIYSSVSPK